MSTTIQSSAASAYSCEDVTARKVHQWAMVALIAVGFLVDLSSGAVFVGLAGLIMLLGRFIPAADVFRQLTWRVLEPNGILRRREVTEDRATRRVARVLGGGIWIACAIGLLLGFSVVSWTLTWLITMMIVLDATVDFCVLCFVFAQLEQRHLMPSALASLVRPDGFTSGQ